ncbi:hypothetical protein TNCT_503741 [Trichonephila clavata]|uniref:Uncharacterized protein n=1 Tax=Trichonephila clavata TaxID=2740835 RepID=A0A8X6IJ03_TRICU|nr:hypothetical protein TNCT_503741 [Trichonephila clavata]
MTVPAETQVTTYTRPEYDEYDKNDGVNIVRYLFHLVDLKKSASENDKILSLPKRKIKYEKRKKLRKLDFNCVSFKWKGTQSYDKVNSSNT